MSNLAQYDYYLRSFSMGEDEGSTFELVKWDRNEPRPEAVYTQSINVNTGEVSYCGCPSRKYPCKHAEISLALLAAAKGKLHTVYWNGKEGKVIEAHDIKEDFSSLNA